MIGPISWWRRRQERLQAQKNLAELRQHFEAWLGERVHPLHHPVMATFEGKALYESIVGEDRA